MSHSREEMYEEEVDRIVAISDKYEQELTRGEHVPAEGMFPEYILLEPRGTFSPRLSSLCALFPFYKQAIVLVHPFRDESLFRQAYGIDLQSFCQLVAEEKILPILSGPYADYPKWYDRLFARFHVPTNRALTLRSISRFGPPSARDYAEDARTWLSRLMPLREQLLHLSSDSPLRTWILDGGFRLATSSLIGNEDLLSLFGPMQEGISDIGLLHLLRAVLGDSLALVSLRYDAIYEACLALPSPELSIASILTVSGCLTRPHIYSLDGWTNYAEEFEHVGQLLSNIGVVQRSATALISPALMAELSIKLGYGHPENQDPIEFTRRIDIREVEENHRILIDAQKYIETGRVQQAFDKIDEARAVIKNINERIAQISRNYKIARYAVYPGFSFLTAAGVTGLLSCIPEVGQYVTFPLFASGATLASLATAAFDSLRGNLDTLSKLLVRVTHVRSSAPYLIWERERTVGRRS